MNSASTAITLLLAVSLLAIVPGLPGAPSEAEESGSGTLDPAAWGSDHVGKPVPEYVTGDECLFCHRSDVGAGWSSNPHAASIRRARPESPALRALAGSPALAAVAREPDLVLLGRRRSVRFLRPNGYGRLSLLEAAWVPAKGGGEKAPEPIAPTGRPDWREDAFGRSCAGCHSTGVDSEGRFADASLDCYVCHGVGKLDHSNDTTRILLSRKRDESAWVVTSICAQCHVRTGRSRSTKRPYPNTFVPGDNLWRDFEVDFSDEAMEPLSPSDRHVLANVRDVVLHGQEKITCLTCHDVHKASSGKHRRLRRRGICWHCHDRDNLEEVFLPLDSRNPTCGY